MTPPTETYWLRQAVDAPLFPDLIWSRPEHTAAAGKLMVIGGNAYAFAAPAQAYSEAIKTGVGTARVLLPDRLHHTVGTRLEADFAPSTSSGSFSQEAMANLMADSAWADGVLLVGDIGRNSETALLLEKYITAYRGQLTLTKDAADYFTAAPQSLLARPETTLVVSFAQLQKLAISAKFSHVLTFSMDLVRLVEALHEFCERYQVNIVVKHLSTIIVASGDRVSTTKLSEDIDVWRVKTATHAAVWWLQNPTKTFEALTTAIWETTSPQQK